MNEVNQKLPPEDFLAQVKQVLENLYKLPYLQTHPLVQTLSLLPQGGESAGQRLRAEVMAAMESLSPTEDHSFRSPQSRLYHLLHLHYVEGMTVQETSQELALSLRQAFRDLRLAEESVATLLWARRAEAKQPEARAVHLSSIQEEVARMETHPRLTDLRPLLLRARGAVEPLSQQRNVRVQMQLPADPVMAFVVTPIAQQVLTSLLSQIVQMAKEGDPPESITVLLHPTSPEVPSEISIEITFAHKEKNSPFAVNEVTGRLLEQLNWCLTANQPEIQPEGIHTGDIQAGSIQKLAFVSRVRVTMMPQGPTILVIDDNEGLVELLQRYLGNHACRVVPTTDAREGLHLARELLPDVIILDVMMPEIDGWQVLQTLRTIPETVAIPVIICSVFNDPQLAYSLGASLFISKPVSRQDVLAALHRLNVV